MGNRLQDKVAVVTGAGRGIGRAVALLLAEEGAAVVVNDLGCEVDGRGASQELADAVVKEIQGQGGKAVVSHENVATWSGAENIIRTAIDSQGKIDILINTVGILRDRMSFQMTEEDWDTVLTNNLKGTFCPTKFAAIAFRQQRGGRILNLTSDAGLGDFGRSNYAAASEGIIGLTRTVARDLGRYGVTCNAISPLARTRLFPASVQEYLRIEGVEGPQDVAGIAPPPAGTPWKGPGDEDDPENVAPLAVWLCTEPADNVNGYVFGARGGDIYLYSNPQIEKAISHIGPFSVDELMEQAPRLVTVGLRHPAPPSR